MPHKDKETAEFPPSDLHEAYDNGARDCAKKIREKFAKTIAPQSSPDPREDR